MKKLFLTTMALAITITSLTGCTSTSYALHTIDGRTIISDGKPDESSTGMLAYTDANGEKKEINKSEVKEISELPH